MTKLAGYKIFCKGIKYKCEIVWHFNSFLVGVVFPEPIMWMYGIQLGFFGILLTKVKS